MDNVQQQLKNVSEYVTGLFNQLVTPDLVYHNLTHTQMVVDRASEIALHYSLDEKDWFILISAAWFHDCGHLFGAYKNHEERSVETMKEYMQSISAPPDSIEMMTGCILSTKMPCNPNTLLQEILCDADVYHFGTEEFLVTNELVRRELELRCKHPVVNYDRNTLMMLKNHHYFTDYCQQLLKNGKTKNIAIAEGFIIY